MKKCVVIPCYNVESHIESVIGSIPDFIDDIIVVDDKSSDNTLKIIKELSKSYPKVHIVENEINRGVGGAMISGFKKALSIDSELVVKIDGDGQMDCNNLSGLIEPVENQTADFSKGNRFHDFIALKQMPLVRRLGNLGLSFLIKMASGYWHIFDPANGFICLNSKTLRQINIDKLSKRFFFESSLLCEVYYTRATIIDIPMPASYGIEKSNLSSFRSLFSFPIRLFVRTIRRIILSYFLYDFNIASIYILFGFPLFFGGVIFGGIKWIQYATEGVPAPTGTVVIPVLLIVLGFQLLLASISFDMHQSDELKPK